MALSSLPFFGESLDLWIALQVWNQAEFQIVNSSSRRKTFAPILYLGSIKLTKKVTFKEQMLEFRQVCTQNLTIVVQISQKLLDFETLHGLQNFLPNLPIFIHRYIRDILQFCVEGVVSKILMKWWEAHLPCLAERNDFIGNGNCTTSSQA